MVGRSANTRTSAVQQEVGRSAKTVLAFSFYDESIYLGASEGLGVTGV